ncbi:hypothetical protein H7097_03165 [Aeromicrobium sp.]|nr:hypothetical protein [Candidatus Saccharibacteria bacterium]
MLRRLRGLMAAGIIAAAPLITLLMPGIAHAATYSCVWTGGGVDSNFSTATNWSGCNSAAPTALDTNDLIFPVTATNLTPVNDLVAATFNSITFSGTGSAGYAISGTAFTLGGDITDTSDRSNSIANDVVVNGARAVTLSNSNVLILTGTVSGTGSVTLNGTDGSLSFVGPVTMTGSMTVTSGVLQMQARSSADATLSSVTVASGATFAYDAFQNSGVSTYTLSTPITSAGGTLDFGTPTGTGTVLNLTGLINLSGDTNVAVTDGTVVHVKGSLHGPGFKLTTANSGAVLNESTDNTTSTPSGDIHAVAGAATTAATTTTPGTPNTGFNLNPSKPILSLVITLLAAGSILGVARVTRGIASRP